MSIDVKSSYNPFIGDPVQSNRLKARCQVLIDGVDITSKLEPHLEEVRVIDGALPEAFIQIDDRDGRMPIPPAQSPVKISMGWANESLIAVFDGYTFDFEHSANRGEGRKMWVHARPINLMSKIKQPVQDHWGEGAPPGAEIGNMVRLGDVLSTSARNGGVSVQVNPKLAKIQRDYWSQNGESFMQFAQRMADDHGGLFAVRGPNQTVVTVPGERADGSSSKISCVAEWGRNLISSRVRPWASRSTWSSSHQQYYDNLVGQWKGVAQQFNLGAPFNAASAMFALPAPAPNKNTAEQNNDGAKLASLIATGEGRIVINGEPSAQWGEFVQLKGVRPGVDGIYYIFSAEHQYSRQTGFTTWLEVRTWLGGEEGSVLKNNFSAIPEGFFRQPTTDK